jgi:hypothetical protein
MRKITMSLMALMILFIGACFHESELVIKNNSTADAWIRVEYGKERYIPPQRSITLSYPSPRTLNIEYQGYHILPGNILLDMNVAGGNHLSLQPNCGAVRIYNSSERVIRDIRVSIAGQNAWGENVLDMDLPPSQYHYISLSPGYYDLKMIDHHFNYYYVSAYHIRNDFTGYYSFSGL